MSAPQPRKSARVELAEIERQLRWVSAALLRRTGRTAIVPDRDLCSETSLRAKTDGQRIYLPTWIELTPNWDLNALAYVRLLAHEAEHIDAGSCTLPADVFARFPRLAHLVRKQSPQWKLRLAESFSREGWLSPAARAQLADGGAMLLQIALHFHRPRALLHLYNLVEDARIERRLRQRLPVMAQLCRLIDAHEVAPAEETLSPEARLHAALFDRLQGRPIRYSICPSMQTLWHEVERILSSAQRPKEAADALVLAIEIYLVLRTDSHPEEDSLIDLMEQSLDERFVEAAVSQQVALSVEDEEVDNEPASVIALPETFESTARYWTYSEWNRSLGRLDEGVVRVHEPASRALSQQRSARTNTPRRYLYEGDELALSRAYDLQVGRITGTEVDERIYRPRARRSERKTIASFVVDLSTSMSREGDDSPLRIARHLVTSASTWLRNAGHETALFGAVDSGRQDIQVELLANPTADITASLRHLGPRASGGFRHGAVVRHLVHRLPQLWPGRRHVLVFITDTASHYLSFGLEKAFSPLREKCLNCGSRMNCAKEPRRPILDYVDGDSPLSVFRSTLYEMKDLAHAVRGSSHGSRLRIPVHGVFIGGDYRDTTLERALGAGGFSRCTSLADVPTANRRIRRAVENF